MTTIAAAVEDLLNNRHMTVADAMDRHFGPHFRQCTNGNWDDRPAVFARIVHLREVVSHAAITVFDELAEGRSYAERHRIELKQRDGSQTVKEVCVFAERDADGRFTRIDEVAVNAEP